MPDSSEELKSISREQSPFWKPRESLSGDEMLELRGTSGVDRLVEIKAKLPHDVDFEQLANELYETLFEPFGHGASGYRQNNSIITGNQANLPDYTQLPKLMPKFAAELTTLFEGAKTDPDNIDKVIACARKAHDIVYIHPFADGNGRVARGLTQYVLRRFGYFVPHWRYTGRGAYLNAVESGRENPLVFEGFLTSALLDTYRQMERRFSKGPHEPLARAAEASRSIIGNLENHLQVLNENHAEAV